MKAFDDVFGDFDEKPAALPLHAAVTENESDADPFAEFFEDAGIAAACGGEAEVDKLRAASAVQTKRLNYAEIASAANQATIRPFAALTDSPLAKVSDSTSARKVRRTFAGGNVVVDEYDAAGSLVRSFIEAD